MSTLCLVEVTQLRTKAVNGRERYLKKKSRQTSSSHADVRRLIFTKFCTVIEEVRAIILGRKRFWVLEASKIWLKTPQSK